MTLRTIRQAEIRQSAILHTVRSDQHDFENSARREVWLRLAEMEKIDLLHQFVLADGETLSGACLYQINPGRSAVVFTPTFGLGDWDADAAARLIGAGAEAAFAAGAVLCHGLLQPEQAEALSAFAAAGFKQLASLLHMERTLSATPMPPGDLRFEAYCAGNAARFADVLGRSYEGTLDCPQLNGRREIEDVIAGHQASGIHDPAYWLLARSGEDVGCLLMNRCRFRPAWEIVYVAVLPEHRGKGYGAQLITHALTVASVNEANAVIVAVDAANSPAVRIYRRLGFEATQQSIALVRFAAPPP